MTRAAALIDSQLECVASSNDHTSDDIVYNTLCLIIVNVSEATNWLFCLRYYGSVRGDNFHVGYLGSFDDVSDRMQWISGPVVNVII